MTSWTPHLPSCSQLVHGLTLQKTNLPILQGLLHSLHSHPACAGAGVAAAAAAAELDAADAGAVHLRTVTHWDNLRHYASLNSHSSGAVHWVASTHY